jgi:hypothetical protein
MYLIAAGSAVSSLKKKIAPRLTTVCPIVDTALALVKKNSFHIYQTSMNHEQILIIFTETTQKLEVLRKSQAYQQLEKSDEFRLTNLSLCQVIDALSEIESMIADIPYVPIYEALDSLSSVQLAGLAILTLTKVHRETMESFRGLYEEFGYYDVPEKLVSAIDTLFTASDYQELFTELTHKLNQPN